MAQEAAVPKGFWARVQKMIDDSIAAYARSGPLRNATISGGAGLKIVDGGVLALVAADGTVIFYIGPLGPALPDGTIQQGWAVNRADGTRVLDLVDIDVSDGVIRQALNWRDRAGNPVTADDTDSGQGIARPYIPIVFYPALVGGVTSTTSGTFVTIWRSTSYKQQPRAVISLSAYMQEAGATGEAQVLVNGTPLGAPQAFGAGSALTFGPGAVSGAHMAALQVEIQVRRTSATGTAATFPIFGYGLQS